LIGRKKAQKAQSGREDLNYPTEVFFNCASGGQKRDERGV
jgi:hypothetical protein